MDKTNRSIDSSINWQKLILKGRVKDVGIYWNEKEHKAVYEYKIPPEFVRKGILTEKQMLDYSVKKNKDI